MSEIRFRPGGGGSAPDPAGGAHDAPPDHLVGLGVGYPLPISDVRIFEISNRIE